MKKAVLFDLDGTLWHTCDVILPVWNDILKKHKETTKQITLEEMNSYMGKTVEQIASIMLPELPLENSVAIVKESCAEQIPSLRKTGGHLYDNLESTLEILSKNYFLGIISNCQCGYIEAFLFAHKLEKYFSDFEMSGRTNLTKGENIKLVMERNGPYSHTGTRGASYLPGCCRRQTSVWVYLKPPLLSPPGSNISEHMFCFKW